MEANKENPNGRINHCSTYPSSLRFFVFIARFCPMLPPFLTLFYPFPLPCHSQLLHLSNQPSMHLSIHLSIQPPKQNRPYVCHLLPSLSQTICSFMHPFIKTPNKIELHNLWYYQKQTYRCLVQSQPIFPFHLLHNNNKRNNLCEFLQQNVENKHSQNLFVVIFCRTWMLSSFSLPTTHTKESHDTERDGWTEQWQNGTADER